MRNYILAFLLSASSVGFVTITFAREHAPDPGYIRHYPNTITIKTFLGEKIAGFSLMDGATSETLLYRPNNVLGIGVGAIINGIGLSISTRIPYHDLKEDQYGRTRQLDLQLHHYKGHLALDGYFQRYTGYHLRDSSDVYAVAGPTTFPYFPDMQSITIGASGMYVFNGAKYSLRAPFDQQDWQVRSSGSWMLGGAIFAHIFDNNDQSLIPPYLKRPDFMGSNQVRSINNYGATVNGGYGYNFIVDKHWFVAAAFDAGVGLGFSEIKDQAGHSHKVGLQLAGNGRFAVGYNSAKWYAGFHIIYHADRYDLPYNQCYLGNQEGLARFTVARRIATKRASKS